MKTAGTFLLIISWVIGIGGIILGIVTYADNRSSSPGIAVIAISVVSWALLYGIGEGFMALDDIARDSRRAADAAERSAEALEYLTRRQRQKNAPQRRSERVAQTTPH